MKVYCFEPVSTFKGNDKKKVGGTGSLSASLEGLMILNTYKKGESEIKLLEDFLNERDYTLDIYELDVDTIDRKELKLVTYRELHEMGNHYAYITKECSINGKCDLDTFKKKRVKIEQLFWDNFKTPILTHDEVLLMRENLREFNEVVKKKEPKGIELFDIKYKEV